jgi:rubrerythrin
MDSLAIFTTALEYEEKIRDLYRTAAGIVDDDRGKAIFMALANDEQGHVDFLHYSLGQLQKKMPIDLTRLKTSIPARAEIDSNLEKMKAKIPERMLGDIKTVLGSALQLEKETSAYYHDARDKSEGEIRKIFDKFYEIEERHVDVVQIELDHAMHNGMWFNFMEVDLEAY